MTRRLRCAFATNSLKRSKIQPLFCLSTKGKLELFRSRGFCYEKCVFTFQGQRRKCKAKDRWHEWHWAEFSTPWWPWWMVGVIFLSKPNRAPTSWVCFCCLKTRSQVITWAQDLIWAKVKDLMKEEALWWKQLLQRFEASKSEAFLVVPTAYRRNSSISSSVISWACDSYGALEQETPLVSEDWLSSKIDRVQTVWFGFATLVQQESKEAAPKTVQQVLWPLLCF